MRRIVLGGLAASVVALTSQGALAQTAGGTFGGAGQLAIQADLELHFEGTTASNNGGSSSDILIQPAADYFVINNLSLGGALTFDNHTDSPGGGGNSTTTTTFGVAPRIGYNIPIVDKLSFWPDLFLFFDTSSRSNNGGSDSAFGIGLYGPVLFHPVEHFFIGLGPNVSTEFSHTFSNNGRSGDAPKITEFGVMLTLGGWI